MGPRILRDIVGYGLTGLYAIDSFIGSTVHPSLLEPVDQDRAPFSLICVHLVFSVALFER